tara:strand:- start:1317 stop:1925 length:609 start_codon:yes stop_codon:yes gene_type:complete
MAYGTLNVGAITPGSGATLTVSETISLGTVSAGTLGSAVVFPAGNIVQIVINSPDVAPVFRAVASFSEVTTALRTAITPKFANSILELQLTFLFSGRNNASISLMKFYDYTNSADVNLATTSIGNRVGCHAGARQKDHDNNDCDSMCMTTSVVSANTNARTYSLYEQSNQATEAIKSFFGSKDDAVLLPFCRPTFKITEIKQ